MILTHLRSLTQIALCLGLLSILPACQKSFAPVSTIAVPRQVLTAPIDPAAPKQFSTNAEWRNGDWVIKKGATVVFRPDGIGSFSARVHTLRPARQQELHFQSVQYGPDGNELFLAPAADLGLAIHARNQHRDFPIDLNFGFDARHFPHIERVSYVSRVRGAEEKPGAPPNHAPSSSKETRSSAKKP